MKAFQKARGIIEDLLLSLANALKERIEGCAVHPLRAQHDIAKAERRAKPLAQLLILSCGPVTGAFLAGGMHKAVTVVAQRLVRVTCSLQIPLNFECLSHC